MYYWHDLRKESRSIFSRQYGVGDETIVKTFENYQEKFANHLFPVVEILRKKNGCFNMTMHRSMPQTQL